MTIYLDLFVLKNLFFDFLIITLCGKMLKYRFNFKRYLYSATIGAIYATLSLIIQKHFLYSISFKFIITIIMVAIAYEVSCIEEFVKPFLLFFLATLTIGGTLFAMNIPINIFYQVCGIVIASTIILLLWKAYKSNILNQSMMCNIEITIDDLKFKSKVFIDTGNNLHDNVSGESVILISKEKLEKELPDELINILESRTLNIPVKYEGKIRMIQYQVINDDCGILNGVRVDSIEVKYNKSYIKNSNVIMALANNKFENCDGLIGLNILEEGYIWK